MKQCQCSRGCTAKVVGKGRRYARGHNPKTRHSLDSVLAQFEEKKKTMTAAEFERFVAAHKAKYGKNSTNKRIIACPYCGCRDGVRAIARHRPSCEKNPHAATKQAA